MLQSHNTEKFENVLYTICKNYNLSFSIQHMLGGFFHEDGRFVKENSIQITFIGGDKNTIDEVSKDICAFFHQESVMVVHDFVDCYYVKNSLDGQ